jgi:hypothetical protein
MHHFSLRQGCLEQVKSLDYWEMTMEEFRFYGDSLVAPV